MCGINDRDATAEDDEVVLPRLSGGASHWGEGGGVGEREEEVDEPPRCDSCCIIVTFCFY